MLWSSKDMGATAFSYDDSHWPMLLVRLEGAPSDAQYAEFFAHGHATLLRRERYVSIFDFNHLTLPSPAQRQRQIQWAREHEALLREYVLGSAFVLSSPFVRTMMNLFFHFAPTPAPYVVVPTLRAGVSWAVERLELAGLSTQSRRIHQHFL